MVLIFAADVVVVAIAIVNNVFAAFVEVAVLVASVAARLLLLLRWLVLLLRFLLWCCSRLSCVYGRCCWRGLVRGPWKGSSIFIVVLNQGYVGCFMPLLL